MSAEYLDLLDDVMSKGVPRHGEKPEGTLTKFGGYAEFDFADGFPLMTVRDLRASFEKICRPEICWIISGSTSAVEAEEKFGLKLWHRWAEDSQKKLGTAPGELGPVYGYQLRHWNGRTDQLKEVLEMLKRPGSEETRRAVISLWNLEDVELGGKKFVNVANCINQIQLERIKHRKNDGTFEERLDMAIVHRSADLAAGVPHDWAGWGIFQMLVAREIGIPPGLMVAHLNDMQIYEEQIPYVNELLKRPTYPRGTVTIEGLTGSIYDARPEHFVLHDDYQSGPKMKMPTAT